MASFVAALPLAVVPPGTIRLRVPGELDNLFPLVNRN